MIIDIVCGVIIAAPTPWTTRKAMSQPISGSEPMLPEKPHRNENVVNTISPAMNTDFCP